MAETEPDHVEEPALRGEGAPGQHRVQRVTRRGAQHEIGGRQLRAPVVARLERPHQRLVLGVTAPEAVDGAHQVGKRPEMIGQLVGSPRDKGRERERFGLGAQSDKTAPEAIESTIPGHFEGWFPGASIRLANGQVWQVNDGSSGVHYIDNPKVRIRHGVFSAYYLEIEGTNRSPRGRP